MRRYFRRIFMRYTQPMTSCDLCVIVVIVDVVTMTVVKGKIS